MNKQRLLMEIHHLAWKGGDRMRQEDLERLQALIDNEIVEEAEAGNLKIKQLSNGFINYIEIVKPEKK